MKGNSAPRGALWSEGELVILRRLAHLGMGELLRQLPGRAKGAIRCKAVKEGIRIVRTFENARNQYRGAIRIPEHVHPLVRRLFREMNRQDATINEVAGRAGVNDSTMRHWLRRSNPNLVQIEACFNAIGLTLKVGAVDDEEERIAA